MELTLTRIAKRNDYTIGRLEADGEYLCDTLEPTWRNLKKKHKIRGRTAIPEGRYPVVITYSPKFGQWLPLVVVLVSGFIGYFISNFISNTAAANLLVPIMSAVGVGMGDSLLAVGGMKTLLVGVALSTSLAMLFPISTPPNALAHSTGLVNTKQMATAGILVGVIGYVLGYVMLIFIGV